MINTFFPSIPSSAFHFGDFFSSVGSSLGSQFGKVHSFLENQLTGELDYSRQKELQDRANAFTANQAQISRNFNSQQAKLQRDFEERMSNTAYSRAFADMRRNGINPYALMQGASTPSGAVASSSSPHGSSAYALKSGQGLMNFFGGLAITALNLAGRALSKGSVKAVQFFDRYGESNGGYYKYY